MDANWDGKRINMRSRWIFEDFHFKIQISYLKVLGQVIKQSLRHQELTTTYTIETLLPQLIHYYQLECTLYLYLMIFHLRPYPLLFFQWSHSSSKHFKILVQDYKNKICNTRTRFQVHNSKYLDTITSTQFEILVHDHLYKISNTCARLQVNNTTLTPPLYSYRTVGSDFGGVLHQRPPVYRLPLEKELHARDDYASSLILPCLLPA